MTNQRVLQPAQVPFQIFICTCDITSEYISQATEHEQTSLALREESAACRSATFHNILPRVFVLASCEVR